MLSQADVPRSDDPTETNRFNALDSGGNLSTWWWNGDIDSPGGVHYFYLDGDSRSNLFVAGTNSSSRFAAAPSTGSLGEIQSRTTVRSR